MSCNRRLALGLTLGDAGGIGPEVALKAVNAVSWPDSLALVLIGNAAVARRMCRQLKYPMPPFWTPEAPGAIPPVAVWDPDPGLQLKVSPGRCTAAATRAAFAAIRSATAAALNGRLAGVVTAPISKQGLALARIPYPGHTEMLAALTGVRRYAMLLIGGGLRVVLATRHIPLAAVPRRVTRRAVVEAAALADGALAWLGVRNRRIGICALNPHAGESGALGREEQRVIAPAVRALRARGIEAEGPVPGDVIFYQALQNRYGAVVAMYHDQGLGPLKMRAFESGVNLTLGLPIVRTSPDHGTAYDIAGRGVAHPGSMLAAIRLAARLARRPNPWRSGNVQIPCR
jgi:4-hydroxythreonine-4-phosphate dehydrogenase